jgi:hypothetical protein
MTMCDVDVDFDVCDVMCCDVMRISVLSGQSSLYIECRKGLCRVGRLTSYFL